MSNQALADISQSPWRDLDPGVIGAARDVPTMLAEEEQLFYYWLTRHWVRGKGAVVDLGCFAGGSTARLAEGHRAAGHPGLIHAYDRFTADETVKAQFLYANGIAPFDGNDILPLVINQLHPWTERIELHPGLIEEQCWDAGPIDLLIMDASKFAAKMDRMAETFFPALVPGQSLVVQQDYLHWRNPWIAVQMSRMRRWLKPVAFARPHTVAFLCIAPISDKALAAGRVTGLSDAETRKSLFAARRHMRALGAASGVKTLIKAHEANPGIRISHHMKRSK